MKLGWAMASAGPLRRPEMFDRWAASLARTNVEGLERPSLQIVYKPPVEAFAPYVEQLSKKFDVYLDEELPGTIWEHWGVPAADMLLNRTDITHIGFLADDFVYNPEWIQQLVKLIERHPTAVSCSVYRSRFTRHHWIVGGDGTDVLMSMHDATGTMTREEWVAFDAKSLTHFNVPEDRGGGGTIDVYHAYARPGERWATSKDYWENLGRHGGIETVDCAIDFVGE